MLPLRQEPNKPHLTSDNKWATKQPIPQFQTTLKAILLNQTFPRANKRRKNPTVAPTHTLKTLLRQIVSNEIENNASQALSRFM
jgi:hypothetical protein